MTAAGSGRHASVHDLRVAEPGFVRLLLLHVLIELLLGLVVLFLGLLHGLLQLPLLQQRASIVLPTKPAIGEATRHGGCGDPARSPKSR